MSNQFKSVFTHEDLECTPTVGPSNYPDVTPTVFSVPGIIKLLSNIDPKKANGPDLIPCRILKEAAEVIAPFLQYLYTQSLESGGLPDDWLKANITPVFKKGSKHLPENYRPISLTPVPCKILEHIIFHDIMSHLDFHNILVKFQHGFCRRLSCETQLVTMIEEVAKSLDKGKQSNLIIMDFSKAFDIVPHQRLIHKLDFYGIRGNLKNWLVKWLTCREQSVVVDGVSSNPVQVSSGVPQGTVLGPLMFLLYINDIGDNCSSSVCLFADDTILYSVIESIDDSDKLQSDLDNIEQWAQKWLMKFNPSKCSVMRITRKCDPVIYDYKLMGHSLKSVSHHPYLGVELSSTLDWNDHINIKVNKANQTLGFLRRNLGDCPESIKELSYKSLVRPHLEYASPVWDPWKTKHIKQIEAVQRRSARFVKNCWDRTPGTVTNLLNDLDWPFLLNRRQTARLTLFHKIIHDEVDIDLPDYIVKKNRSLRHYHQNKFIELQSNTEAYRNSFYCKTIRDWNSLPNNILDIDNSRKFKLAFNNFLNE